MNTPSPSVEDQLRLTLQRHANGTAPRADAGDVRRRVQRRHRRRRVVPAVGAVAVVAAGIVSIGLATDDSSRTATSADGTVLDDGAVLDDGTVSDDPTSRGAIPNAELPGWDLARATVLPPTSDISLLAQVLVHGEGARIKAGVAIAPIGYGVNGSAIDVNGAAGVIGTDPSGVAVVWKVHGNDVFVIGQGVTEDDVLVVARGLSVSEDMHITATAAPDGMTIESLELPDPGINGAEYEFARDGRRLQAVLYPSGRPLYFLRAWDQQPTDPWGGNEAALVDYGDGRYRLTVALGNATLEFDGDGFADLDEFRSTVDAFTFRSRELPPTGDSSADAQREAAKARAEAATTRATEGAPQAGDDVTPPEPTEK